MFESEVIRILRFALLKVHCVYVVLCLIQLVATLHNALYWKWKWNLFKITWLIIVLKLNCNTCRNIICWTFVSKKCGNFFLFTSVYLFIFFCEEIISLKLLALITFAYHYVNIYLGEYHKALLELLMRALEELYNRLLWIQWWIVIRRLISHSIFYLYSFTGLEICHVLCL